MERMWEWERQMFHELKEWNVYEEKRENIPKERGASGKDQLHDALQQR